MSAEPTPSVEQKRGRGPRARGRPGRADSNLITVGWPPSGTDLEAVVMSVRKEGAWRRGVARWGSRVPTSHAHRARPRALVEKPPGKAEATRI